MCCPTPCSVIPSHLSCSIVGKSLSSTHCPICFHMMELLALLVTYLCTPLSFCHSARLYFTPLKWTRSHYSITHYLQRPLVQILFPYFPPFHFYTCSALPTVPSTRHIVCTPTSAISYARVSHMLLPVRHALSPPPPHKLCMCVSIFNFTSQMADTLLDWNKFLHMLPRQIFRSLYYNVKIMS